MKNYLALHIDTDFLVGTICADEGNLSYHIKSSNDEYFWLYFYNDPFSNDISFGKDNQKHCNKSETNYIGNFIELIENENNTFQIGAYECAIIELLRYSKIIEKLKTSFSTQTYESQENIPTLLTFSLSIKELAKKIIVDYLIKQGFNIISYTIPLAELACKYAILNSHLNFNNGNIVTFLETTNANLHLAKLIYTTDYFLSDGNPEPKQGLGIDPRRRALLKYVVNKIGTMGVLSEDEKEIEYKLMEPKTIDWLNDLDMQINNAPFPIIESLSKMPNQKRRVLVYKDKLSEFTQKDIKLIIDTYKDYVDKNITQDLSAIVLLGNLFQNEIITKKFQSLIAKDRLIVFTNKDIKNILSIYPKIDFNRYISEQGRIEAKAIADKLKKAEELAKEAAKVKADKDAKEIASLEAKKENEKQKARELYEQALKFEKEENLDLALLTIKNAISLDPERTEYPRFRDVINAKIKEITDKTDKYKSWLKDGETYEQSGELDLAIKAFNNAQQIFDSAELRKKIVQLEREIEKQLIQSKVNSLIAIALTLAESGKFDDAIADVNKVLEIDPNSKVAKETLKIIYAQQINLENEKEYKSLIAEADKYFEESSFDKATVKYNEASLLKHGDKYCEQQIGKIKNLIEKKQNQEKCEKIISIGDELFLVKNWTEARVQYEVALSLCPQNKLIIKKINDCELKSNEIEGQYNKLFLDALSSRNKGKLNDAIDILLKAKEIKPNDAKLLDLIKNIRLEISFGKSSVKSNETLNNTNSNDDGFDFRNKNNTKVIIKNEKSSSTKAEAMKDFLKKEERKNHDNNINDDFFQKSKNTNDNFFTSNKQEKRGVKPQQNKDQNDFFKK